MTPRISPFVPPFQPTWPATRASKTGARRRAARISTRSSRRRTFAVRVEAQGSAFGSVVTTSCAVTLPCSSVPPMPDSRS